MILPRPTRAVRGASGSRRPRAGFVAAALLLGASLAEVWAPSARRPESLRPALTMLSALAPIGKAAAQDAAPNAIGPWDGAQGAPGGQPAQPARPATRPARPAAGRNLQPSDSGPVPSADLTPEIVFQLLASEIAAQRGQTANATATYLALARKIRDPRLARRATELALSERSIDRALQAARLWQELAPDTPSAAQTLESLLLGAGRLDEARPLAQRRLAAARSAGTLDEAYALLQRALARSPDKSAAFALLDELAAADTGSLAARLALAAQAQAAGLTDRAALEAGRALALKPDDERIALLAAQFVQATAAGTAGALRVLEAFLGAHPRAIEARFQYARLLASAGRADDARRTLEAALAEQPDNPSVLFTLAQLAWQNRQPEAATAYLTRILALPAAVAGDHAATYLLLAQIAEERRDLPQAIAWLERIVEGEQARQALLRRAVLIARNGAPDAARALLRGVTAGSAREQTQLIAAEAQVLREAGRPTDAFALLDQALASQPDNLDLLYDHAMAAERLERLDTMEASLRRLIRARPDHAHAHNALGYSLADRGLRLEEAQALIERALQLAPDDPHILDSMGWVLFKRGQAERAVEYLRRAYTISPDAEVAAHLGEVLWTLGRLDEARRLWAEAREREPDNRTLKDTLARLNVAL
jgi:tetratricopeptide (TPR) repeat protein